MFRYAAGRSKTRPSDRLTFPRPAAHTCPPGLPLEFISFSWLFCPCLFLIFHSPSPPPAWTFIVCLSLELGVPKLLVPPRLLVTTHCQGSLHFPAFSWSQGSCRSPRSTSFQRIPSRKDGQESSSYNSTEENLSQKYPADFPISLIGQIKSPVQP